MSTTTTDDDDDWAPSDDTHFIRSQLLWNFFVLLFHFFWLTLLTSISVLGFFYFIFFFYSLRFFFWLLGWYWRCSRRFIHFISPFYTKPKFIATLNYAENLSCNFACCRRLQFNFAPVSPYRKTG